MSRISRTAERLALVVLSVVPMHESALAQPCEPEWLEGNGAPGVWGGSLAARASVAWDPDGVGPAGALLVVGGTFAGAGEVSALNIASWDGVEWQSLSSGVDQTVLGLTTWDADADGPLSAVLVAAGWFAIAGGVQANCVAVWDGEAWLPMGSGMSGGGGPVVEAVASWDPDGDGPQLPLLVAGGDFALAGGVTAVDLAAWDGSSWQALGSGTDGVIFEVASWDRDGDGPDPALLVIGGSFSAVDGVPASNIATWNGTVWQPLGAGVNGAVVALTSWDPDGDGPLTPLLGVGGWFDAAGGQGASMVATWNGVAWSALGAGIEPGQFHALTSWDADDSGPALPLLVGAGIFSTAGGAPASNIAAWNGTAWQELGGGTSGAVETVTAWDPDGFGPEPMSVAACGAYAEAGGRPAMGVATWDGAEWQAAGSGTDGIVYELVGWDRDGSGPLAESLFAGGTFLQMAGAQAQGIAQTDGISWQPLGMGTAGGFSPMTVWDSDSAGPKSSVLVVGSVALDVGGAPGISGVSIWDGAAWQSLGSGMAVTAALCTWDPDGAGPQVSRVIAGGFFPSHVAAWDGANWSTLGPGMSDAVTSLFAWDPDDGGAQEPLLIAGGRFLVAGGTPANHIAQWDGASWQPLGSGSSNFVEALTAWDLDGSGPLTAALIAGGGFTFDGGATYQGLAAWSGASWLSIGGGVDGPVYAFAPWDADGGGPLPAALVATGVFSHAGGVPANNIAAWDGVAWSAMDIGLNDVGLSLASWDPDGAGPATPWLAVGGGFSSAGGTPSVFYAVRGRTRSVWSASGGGLYSDASRWLCATAPTTIDRLFFDNTQGGYPDSVFQVSVASGGGDTVTDSIRARTDVVTLDLHGTALRLRGQGRFDNPSLIVGELPNKAAVLRLRNSFGNAASLFTNAVVIGQASTLTNVTSELSIIDNRSTLRVAGDCYIGRRANQGVLSIHAGGSAVVDGNLSVGTELGAVGELLVDGPGSTLIHSLQGSSVSIGQRGHGVLQIGGGGGAAGASAMSEAQLDTLTIGASGGAIGTVQIAGPGSLWELLARNIYIGHGGLGRISISGGASLDTTTEVNILIGRFPTSAGSEVKLVDAGSAWIERQQAITIGSFGVLTIGEGASVHAPAVELRPEGVLRGSGLLAPAPPARGTLLVTNGGVIDPAFLDAVSQLPIPGAATLTIDGSFTQLSAASVAQDQSGALKSDIAGLGPEADVLNVTGVASLAGALIVERDPTFSGAVQGPLEVLRGDSGISGFFDVCLLPPVCIAESVESACEGVNRSFLLAEVVGGSAPLSDGQRGPQSGSVVLTIAGLTPLITTQPGSSESLSGIPASAVVGDFDGVNGVDVAVVIPNQADPTGANGDLVILVNQGTTGNTWDGWSTVQMNGAVGRNPSDIATAEIDGQPGLDLVVSEASDNTVSVLRNLGGSFLPRQTFGVGEEPRGVVAADLDGDGFADVATANATSGTISILRNQQAPGGTWLGLGQSVGDQRIEIEADPASLTPRPVDIAAVQLNGEPGDELVSANEGASSTTIIANAAGAGTWQALWNLPPIRQPTTTPPTKIQPGNMDEDKWQDVVVASRGGGTAGIVLNDRQIGDSPGLIRMRPYVGVPLQSGDTTDALPSSIVLADMDDDGDLDLAMAAFNEVGDRTVIVLRNDEPIDGTVTLSRDADLVAGGDPQIVLAGNVDADAQGRDDLIVLNGDAMLRPASQSGEVMGKPNGMLNRGAPMAPESRVLLSVPASCPGNANGDGTVNFDDINAVISNWLANYSPGTGPGDANQDGVVNFDDVNAVLSNWLSVCP